METIETNTRVDSYNSEAKTWETTVIYKDEQTGDMFKEHFHLKIKRSYNNREFKITNKIWTIKLKKNSYPLNPLSPFSYIMSIEQRHEEVDLNLVQGLRDNLSECRDEVVNFWTKKLLSLNWK